MSDDINRDELTASVAFSKIEVPVISSERDTGPNEEVALGSSDLSIVCFQSRKVEFPFNGIVESGLSSTEDLSLDVGLPCTLCCSEVSITEIIFALNARLGVKGSVLLNVPNSPVL